MLASVNIYDILDWGGTKWLFLVMVLVMPLASLLTWAERRQSAMMQDRLGPNRANIGPIKLKGILHFVADALKMIFKEDFVPANVHKGLFALAPILALAPLIALWFGSGLVSKLVICSLIVFFPVAVATMVGIRSVDRRLLEMGRSFRATRWQVITKLEIPAALPAILGGMRVGATLAVIGAIVGEWAGGDNGLGVLVNLALGSLFDIPLMFATLMTIGLLGVALYLVMVLIEHRLVGER